MGVDFRKNRVFFAQSVLSGWRRRIESRPEPELGHRILVRLMRQSLAEAPEIDADERRPRNHRNQGAERIQLDLWVASGCSCTEHS